jgi:hypothetical protein
VPRSRIYVEARTRYGYLVAGRIEVKRFIPRFDLIEGFGVSVVAPLLESLQSWHVNASALSLRKQTGVSSNAAPYLIYKVADGCRFSSTRASKYGQCYACI